MDIPSSVRHSALRISRVNTSEIVPEWDPDKNVWRLSVNQSVECSDHFHDLIHVENCSSEGHRISICIEYSRTKRTHGMKSWKNSLCTIQMDDNEPVDVPISLIASLLASQAPAHGDGKVVGESLAAVNTGVDVRKSTVIRV